MILKQYQAEAVNKLLTQTKKLLNKEGERVCVFKAPTGSGKTIMAADFLKQLSSEQLPTKYAFIWISSHDLHTQSKEKLEAYLADSAFTFSFLEEIQDNAFKENEIVFVNWHSLVKKSREGEWANVLMRDNEDDRNLPSFIRHTKQQNREIILIVDESHHHYWSIQSQELVNGVIAPKLTIEVSATPLIEPEAQDVATGNAGYVVVPHEAVVSEGMIKASIVVNKEIGAYRDLRNSVDEAIVDASLEKQKELTDLYQQEGATINPLILIQLPSETQNTSPLDKSKIEAVETYLSDKHGVTVENGKLAIWLADRKENLEHISEHNNDVQVLIFKQAIALGWDCPRAQILIMFREIGNPTFEIQTVGRILRMPEAKHYETSALNDAYVYTNLGEVRIASDDDSQRFFDVHPSHRDEAYKNIDLPSVYISRTDYGDLTLSFRKLFFEEANKRFGIIKDDIGKAGYDKADKLLELYLDELTKPVISDAIIQSIDGAHDVIGDMVEFTVHEADLKHKYELFAKLVSLPYVPSRSNGIIQHAIYDWFDNFLGYRGKSRAEIQRVIVCSEPNQKIFTEIIEATKVQFEKQRKEELNKKQKIREYTWNVPAVDYFNEKYEKVEIANNVMSPCYLGSNRSNPEKEFEAILAASDLVSWWYKNRESKETYLSIAYPHPEGVTRAFYPDYVVQMKDGAIGIYDTKSGFTATAEETAAKSDALQKYIRANKQKKLHGGIVVFEQTGTYVFTGTDYNADTAKADWERLSL